MDRLRVCEPLLHARRVLDFILVGLLVALAILVEQMFERRDDPDADRVVVLRDVPEPPLLVAGLNHERGAFVAAAIAVRAFPVGPDRPLVQDRVPDPQLEPVLQHRGLPAGVDHDLRKHVSIVVLLVANLHAHRTVAVEQHLENAHAFLRVDAVLAGVVEHHLVEFAADHLPGLRAFVRLVVPEVEGRRLPAARVDELHAVLLDEGAGLHLRQHVELLQHPVGLGNQRLPDVKAGESIALEELHTIAALSDERGCG